MSLHRSLTLFVVAIATLALGAAVSLILLTTYLHRTNVELEIGLQSVRLAEEMQIDLLTYVETRDAVARAVIESDLRQKLHQARQFVNDPEEERALADAAQLIEEHFSSQRRTPNQEQYDGNMGRAFTALRRFVDVNVEQADASLQASGRWDDMGDRIGLGVSAGLIIGVALMLIWLRRVAFRPVFEIRDAMKDFATGRKDARATEYGPEELRSIAAQFNGMADALARQYDNQLVFLAAVAHDLRNPLSALKVSADILSRDETIPPEKLSSIMSVVKRQVYRLDRMIGDLLDASRIEAGQLELRLEDCDARKIGQDVFDLFSSASPGHQFMLKVPDAPVPLRCDPLRIEQVLNNLMSNAIKYSPEGGTIELSVENQDNEVLFAVSDRGRGISPDELPYIFEPFRRTRTLKDEVPGVGLGLSVARRIVQRHGGRILAESEVGNGTRFCVYLHKPSAIIILDRAV